MWSALDPAHGPSQSPRLPQRHSCHGPHMSQNHTKHCASPGPSMPHICWHKTTGTETLMAWSTHRPKAHQALCLTRPKLHICCHGTTATETLMLWSAHKQKSRQALCLTRPKLHIFRHKPQGLLLYNCARRRIQPHPPASCNLSVYMSICLVLLKSSTQTSWYLCKPSGKARPGKAKLCFRQASIGKLIK